MMAINNSHSDNSNHITHPTSSCSQGYRSRWWEQRLHHLIGFSAHGKDHARSWLKITTEQLNCSSGRNHSTRIPSLNIKNHTSEAERMEGAARPVPRLCGIAPTSDALLNAVHFATLTSMEKQMWADVSIFILGS